MQITPNLITQHLNPHAIEHYKDNGKYYQVIGKRIKGEDVKSEIVALLQDVKVSFEEGKNV